MLVKGSKKKRQTGGENVNFRSLDEVVADCTDPLIGLEHIRLDIDKGIENGYHCEICTSFMNIGNILAHLTGGRHRENYINKNPVHATYAEEIKMYMDDLEREEREKQAERAEKGEGEAEEEEEVYPRRSLINKKLQHFATIIEEQYGRQATKVDRDLFAEAKRKAAQEKAAKMAVPGEPGTGKKGRRVDKSDVEKQIYEGDEPMIGLDHVTEILNEAESLNPNYQCDVCDTLLNHGNLYSHVSGVKHRHNYITMFHPELKEELRKQRKEEEAEAVALLESEDSKKERTGHDRTVFLREMAFKVESLTGRKKMKKEFIPDPNKKKQPPKRANPDRSQGGRGQGGRGQGGRGLGGRGQGGRGQGGRGQGRGARERPSDYGGGRRGARGADYGGYGGDHGYGGEGYGKDYYGDDYYGDDYYSRLPPRPRDLYDDYAREALRSYDRYDDEVRADPRDAIRNRMRRASGGRPDPYGDYARLPRRRPAPQSIDDYLFETVARQSAAKEKDMSDASLLAEFEKRFGKRIKLGDDSNTIVLASGGSSQAQVKSESYSSQPAPRGILKSPGAGSSGLSSGMFGSSATSSKYGSGDYASDSYGSGTTGETSQVYDYGYGASSSTASWSGSYGYQ
ncbi:uncharacterized protein [Amphiura filiformis]